MASTTLEVGQPKTEINPAPENLSDYIDHILSLLQDKSSKFEITTTGMGAWGPSRIKSLTQCPLQFLLKTLLKVSYTPLRSEEEIRDNAAKYFSKVGTAAHYILELMVQGKTYQEAYQETYDTMLSDVTIHHWALVEELEANIRFFMNRLTLFSLKNPIERMETEVFIALDSEWRPVHKYSKNAYIRGIIDLPVRLVNKDALLIDHKRGGSATYGVKVHDLQLKMYALMYCAANPDIRGVTPMIHYIQEGTIATGAYIPREKALTEFANTIDSAIHGAVYQVNEFGKFKHKTGHYCDYCDFKDLCRGGKRGTANLLQPVVEASKVFFRR